MSLSSLPLGAAILPVLLLIVSNVFMSFAWYGHPEISRPIALDRRAGELGDRLLRILPRRAREPSRHQVYSAAELKTIHEVVMLCVFAVFSVTYLREALTLNHLVGFALIGSGAFFVSEGPL